MKGTDMNTFMKKHITIFAKNISHFYQYENKSFTFYLMD